MLSLRRLFGVATLFAVYFAVVAWWLRYMRYREQTDNLPTAADVTTLLFMSLLLLGAICLPLIFFLSVALRRLHGKTARRCNIAAAVIYIWGWVTVYVIQESALVFFGFEMLGFIAYVCSVLPIVPTVLVLCGAFLSMRRSET